MMARTDSSAARALSDGFAAEHPRVVRALCCCRCCCSRWR